LRWSLTTSSAAPATRLESGRVVPLPRKEMLDRIERAVVLFWQEERTEEGR
jgi:hypothetical protein